MDWPIHVLRITLLLTNRSTPSRCLRVNEAQYDDDRGEPCRCLSAHCKHMLISSVPDLGADAWCTLLEPWWVFCRFCLVHFLQLQLWVSWSDFHKIDRWHWRSLRSRWERLRGWPIMLISWWRTLFTLTNAGDHVYCDIQSLFHDGVVSCSSSIRNDGLRHLPSW